MEQSLKLKITTDKADSRRDRFKQVVDLENLPRNSGDAAEDNREIKVKITWCGNKVEQLQLEQEFLKGAESNK